MKGHSFFGQFTAASGFVLIGGKAVHCLLGDLDLCSHSLTNVTLVYTFSDSLLGSVKTCTLSVFYVCSCQDNTFLLLAPFQLTKNLHYVLGTEPSLSDSERFTSLPQSACRSLHLCLRLFLFHFKLYFLQSQLV